MKRALRFTYLALVVFGLTHIFSSRLAAQSRIGNYNIQPRDGACFFMDEDYRGDSFCMNAGESQRNVEGRFSDKISSIRIFGRARVVVYENESFRGAGQTFSSDTLNLENFNDKITSIDVR
jgi:hypothetical protein